MTQQHYKILIIGSGFAGLGMGIRLKQHGENDFVIVERASDVGGTWRDNTYPGAACDVPSHLYSFSFRMNPNWSSVFSPGTEIQKYMQDAAREEGLLPHIKFNADVKNAQWQGKHWIVETSAGTFTADYVITGTGHLADEHLPNIPGLASFSGHAFHSARWNHNIDLKGKRIGVVGTGASAIQIVPEMAKVASELVVFMRTPPYLIPRVERRYTEGEKRMFRRMPETMQALRSEFFWVQENVFAQRRAVQPFLNMAKKMSLDHLENQVADPELRAKLTPNYEPGCKRVLISNTFYPALQQPNVTVESSALQSVNGSTATAASGNQYDLDVLVFATGFEATQPPFAKLIRDEAGLSLAEHWQQGMHALDSVSVAGFPNLFLINGPNTSLGHNSIVYIIEAQIDYILGALDYAKDHGYRLISPSKQAETDYVDKLQREAAGTVWLDGGCNSWYVDERSGRLTLIWPDFGFAFKEANGTFKPENYTYA